ncbi:uncharacterized protein LOC135710100 [Ochlerotatus camptorhynchus]|uniref:uncharacterized protein LOC135710100 n=1 Tax=Ochlerotatus camptorhynchus TaxID=644619 RepID=UPI0031DAA0DE
MSNMLQYRNEPGVQQVGFRCEICSGLFSRPYLLKSHEQKIHGLVREESPKPAPPPATLPVPCITTVVIPAIQTSAMIVAKERGEIPFAVLHMMNEIPLIVRVVEQGKYSVLKAAESNDFRESQRGGPGLEEAKCVSIAVVATVYQKINEKGQHYFEITGPVSCYQTNKIPQVDRTAGALQDSIANTNLHKTLTQLNATEVSTNINMLQKDLRLPALRPFEVNGPVASTSGINKLKRKQTPKKQSNPAPVPIKRAPLKQPKVTTVMDNSVEWTHSTRPVMAQICERNFQSIATGSLLSPERATLKLHKSDEVMAIEQEDPFSDINMFDLIQTGNELLSNDGHLQDIDIDDSMEEIFVPVL